jgi:hypothetical protein
MEIKCPITNEVILKITPNGMTQRINYCEIWLHLIDGSRMKLAISKNAKKNLKQSHIDEIFAKIKADRLNRIRGKALPAKVKAIQLARIEKTDYREVIDKAKSLIKKKINDN